MTDNSSIIKLTAAEIAAKIASGELTAVEVTEAHLARIEAVDEKVHAFLHVDREGALAQARAVDAKRAAGEKLGPLAGVPLALKDIFTTEGIPTTVGSKILEGWIPPYDATVTKQAEGRRRRHPRQDQHGRVRHGVLHREQRLRPDRQPVGPHPDPRRLRRRLLAPPSPPTRPRSPSARTPAAPSASPPPSPARSASSRPTARSPATAWSPSRPPSTRAAPAPVRSWTRRCCTRSSPATTRSTRRPSTPRSRRSSRPPATARVDGMRVGVVKQFAGEGYQAGVVQRFNESVELLKSLGAEIVELDCPSFDLALSAYYLIAPSECSSQPGPLRRHALRPAGRRRRHEVRRGGHRAHPRGRLRRRGQAPHHPRHVRAQLRLLRRVLRLAPRRSARSSPGTSRRPSSRST